MAYATINGTKLWYTDSGSGDTTILFVHGLLLSGRMYAHQVESLSAGYRCVTLDLRGQGQSGAANAGYDIDSLTDDVVALIQQLDLAPCHFVGLSMGGFIGLRLGIHHPELLISLALLDTSADPEPAASVREYRIMLWLVRLFGFRPLIGRVMKIMFGQSFLSDPRKHDLRAEWRGRILANDRKGIIHAAAGVIDRAGVYECLDRVSCPTMVLVGEEDVATPPLRAQRIHEAITGSRLVAIAQAGHSSTIEQPEAVTRALEDFFSSLQRPEQQKG